MFKKYLLQFKTSHLRALQEQKGQSLIIFVFAIMGLIAMLGLALDLGLVYIERVRVSRTTDAAALAAVVELPFEEEAMRRAAEFIELNGYTQEDTEIRVRGCIDVGGNLRNVGDGNTVYPEDDPVDIQPDDLVSGYVYQPSLSDPPRNIFVIDTLGYQPVDYNPSDSTDPADITTENQDNCTSSGGSSLYGTANKLRVTGQVNVDMNFMQFFGFGEVPVSDEAVGENVTNLDVAVVFDVSGSMNFETTCFGCWNEIAGRDVLEYPFPSNGDFNELDYDPDGDGGDPPYDIFWDGDIPGAAGHPVCEDPPQSTTIPPAADPDSHKYLVHEAEFYSRDFPLHGWEFDKRSPGQGFWVLQRTNDGSNDAYIRPHVYTVYSQSDTNNFPQLQGAAYNSECFDGPNLSGQCWKSRADALGETAPSNPPWVEYDFTPDWDGDTHIWIRAIGGGEYADQWNGRSPNQLYDWEDAIYWQVDLNADQTYADDIEDVKGGNFDNVVTPNWQQTDVDDSDWRWIKLGTAPTTTAGTQHSLRLYQGSTGFRVDKIVFTNNDDGEPNSAVRNNGSTIGGGFGGSDDIEDVLSLNGGRGPDATNGSATREACNACNPTFGQTVDPDQCSCRTAPDDTDVGSYPGGGTGLGCTAVLTTTNMLENDLFHDVDPLRSAQEAVKNFAARLDPKFDQLGVVAYSSGIEGRVKLQCLRWAGAHETEGTAKCFDPTTDPISYTNVIRDIEDYNPGGGTDIPEGMREGLEELGIEVPGYNEGVTSECSDNNNDKKSCDRRGAARRVLILMTDGSPNNSVSCPGSFIWRGQFGGGGVNNAYDCSIYYASVAADNNVVVYTIGIGSGVNVELLTAMATGTDPNPVPGDDGFYFEGKGGKYFPAAQPDDLDAIFEQILNNIFVRIVG